MKRREVLKYTAYATGLALSAPLLFSLSSCKADQLKAVVNYEPTFFSLNEFEFLENLVDTILPKTDSPAASEVGVHQIIDNMVGSVYIDKSKSEYREKFNSLYSQINVNNEFKSASTEERVNLVSKLKGDALGAFNKIKQQTIAYYLSTEEIGKNYLNYLPVPGEYDRCISLESVGGKKWAI